MVRRGNAKDHGGSRFLDFGYHKLFFSAAHEAYQYVPVLLFFYAPRVD
jgi:hypothetical protein